MSLKHTYVEKREAELQEWNETIRQIEERASRLGSQLRSDQQEHLQAIRALQAAARQRLHEVKTAGGKVWLDNIPALEKTWQELGDSLKAGEKIIP